MITLRNDFNKVILNEKLRKQQARKKAWKKFWHRPPAWLRALQVLVIIALIVGAVIGIVFLYPILPFWGGVVLTAFLLFLLLWLIVIAARG